MGLYYVQHMYVTCDLSQRQSNFKQFMELKIVNIHNKYILKTTKDLCFCNGRSDKSHLRKERLKLENMHNNLCMSNKNCFI